VPEFPHLRLAQRRPAAEEDRHACVPPLACSLKLRAIERRQVPRKTVDHELYGAPAPYGTLSEPFLSSPNSWRIFFAQLRVTRIETSISAALGAMAGAVKAEREQ
jgi:hypothetical protein